MISVLIITKNESIDIVGCIKSVDFSDDVVVLDSYSDDDTCNLAKLAGARVFENKFLGYASQRNFGLSLPFKNKWVLILDADERVPANLAREALDFIATTPSDVCGARVMRRDIWWGKWLKHAQISPYFIRLVRIGFASYRREVNEVIDVQGKVVDLKSHFDHFPFSKGLAHWIDKHNRYSSMEAQEVILLNDGGGVLSAGLFSLDFNVRRFHQKRFFYKMPCRPIIKFIYMLIIRRAILDGVSGIRYCILQAIYEYFIVLKTKELRIKIDKY
jgi:glycosyltransferase involved in cell wall biosynthesis